MIKLLWNTSHHQEDSFELNWGRYHEKNSKDWIHFLLKDLNYTHIDVKEEVKKDDTLVIVDSGIHFKEQFYKPLKEITKNFFLFHLSDEHLDKRVSSIYKYFDHIWRTYCSPSYVINKKVTCIPPGYKSGFDQEVNINEQRKFKWSFFGTLHKSSRHDMNFQLKTIKSNFTNVTEKFADENKSMNAEEMKKILLNSNFAPCPAGFYHPDSYRIYEALQCGTIPIVESIYNYFDHSYLSNPLNKIAKWSEAKEIIDKWSFEKILSKRKECLNWWNEYKTGHRNFIFKKIGN